MTNYSSCYLNNTYLFELQEDYCRSLAYSYPDMNLHMVNLKR